MILTTVSPDKTSLSMFLDFYKTIYDEDVKIYILNSLFSKEVIEERLKSVIEEDGKSDDLRIILYKIKSKTKNIPDSILKASLAVIKFDIFSYTPEVIKNDDSEGKIETILERWNVNMKRLNG